MGNNSKKGFSRPFRNLDTRVPYAHLPAERPPVTSADPGGWTPDNPEEDRSFFLAAMSDVIPLTGRNKIPNSPKSTACRPDTPESETLARLNALVRDGSGFDVSLTPEYLEGGGRGVCHILARRLFQGHFPMETHLDLHGMTRQQAKDAFDRFLSDAVRSGKRGVLVIHGRGLSSPGEPILKTNVAAWLSSGPWRRWVLAYSSARPCDGGAGATCVLLRKRPAPRKIRRRSGGLQEK